MTRQNDLVRTATRGWSISARDGFSLIDRRKLGEVDENGGRRRFRSHQNIFGFEIAMRNSSFVQAIDERDQGIAEGDSAISVFPLIAVLDQ